MRKLFLTILLLGVYSFAQSQLPSDNPDSLRLLADKTVYDTTKVQLYALLGHSYAFIRVDSSIAYCQKAISLARHIQFKEGEAYAMFAYGWSMWASGNYDKAIEAALKSLNLYKNIGNYEMLYYVYCELGILYRDAGDFRLSLKYGEIAMHLYDSLKNVQHIDLPPWVMLASIFIDANQMDSASRIDSASFYIKKEYDEEKAISEYVGAYTYDVYGDVETRKKNYQKALAFYDSALYGVKTVKNNIDLLYAYYLKARSYQQVGNMDSSIWYAKVILSRPEFSHNYRPILEALIVLEKDYRQMKNRDSTLKYLELRVAMNDTLFNQEKARAVQNQTFNEEMQQQEIESARKQYQNQVRLYGVFALAGVFLLIGIILYRNNKLKQKTNSVLLQEKQKVESTLKALESTQSQLIQSEKMASLGELTAGIAHEIQNPLNFVNNFSEVNEELLIEMKEEIDGGNTAQAKSIADTVIQNQQKINMHGRRADSIVKSMLQHSGTSTGQKEPVDVNALAVEYLNLSYHGFRAKEKDFNVVISEDFDSTLEKVNVIPQDIGRVLLNLYNNAFYAMAEKKKKQEAFEPRIDVSTRNKDHSIEVSVKDNGNGIPQKILDKIFQPFFTTKPTGQGTGLGLSLSFDIIKTHGGEIKVNTEEGKFTEFTIILRRG
jgi:two-component system, NtrC family, sensor kinase